jgi:hypothetical protein
MQTISDICNDQRAPEISEECRPHHHTTPNIKASLGQTISERSLYGFAYVASHSFDSFYRSASLSLHISPWMRKLSILQTQDVTCMVRACQRHMVQMSACCCFRGLEAYKTGEWNRTLCNIVALFLRPTAVCYVHTNWPIWIEQWSFGSD